MATQALDLSTIAGCLQVLDSELAGPLDWTAISEEQKLFFAWLADHKDVIAQLKDLVSKASTDYKVLNAFMVDHKLDPQFGPFEGIGVASIIDMLGKWLRKGTESVIFQDDTSYPAFTLAPGTAEIYEVRGFPLPLAKLKARDGRNMWTIMMLQPTSGLDLAMTAQELASARKRPIGDFPGGVILPKFDIHTKPDLGWLLKAYAHDTNRALRFIAQAFQEFKLRVNEVGFRVVVGTGVVLERNTPPAGRTLDFDQPFAGYFTQDEAGDDLPVAAFYCDRESWKEPAGSLEDL